MSRQRPAAAPRQVSGTGGRSRAWVPTVLFIAIILVSASRPLPLALRGGEIDKLLHGAAYFLLAVLAFRSFTGSGHRRPAVAAVVLSLAVACSDEAIQGMGRSRTIDRYDLFADGAGTLIAAVSVMVRRQTGRPSVDNSLSH